MITRGKACLITASRIGLASGLTGGGSPPNWRRHLHRQLQSHNHSSASTEPSCWSSIAPAASGSSAEWEGFKPLDLSVLQRSGNPASFKLVILGTRCSLMRAEHTVASPAEKHGLRSPRYADLAPAAGWCCPLLYSLRWHSDQAGHAAELVGKE